MSERNSFNAEQEVKTLELAAQVTCLAGLVDERIWGGYDDQATPGARAARVALGTAGLMYRTLVAAGVRIRPEQVSAALQYVNEGIARELANGSVQIPYNISQQEGE